MKSPTYLASHPRPSALKHRDKCYAEGLDDRVACGGCAGFSEKTKSKATMDDKTRISTGYRQVTMGACKWVDGAMDADRLHRCDFYSPIPEHQARIGGLKQALTKGAGHEN